MSSKNEVPVKAGDGCKEFEMAIEPQSILRLNMPQWQGGNNPAYRIGGKGLAAAAPEPAGPGETIAIPPGGAREPTVEDGIVSRDVLLQIVSQAQAAIARHQPRAIVTLGGDCLIDLAPIAYLNERYAGDLAVLWIDAHPDIMDAGQFAHAHAHVLGMLMGKGDGDFVASVPRPVAAEDILYIGLNDPTPYEAAFVADHAIAHVGPDVLEERLEPVLEWLEHNGARHVAVHFDLDVLDPALYDYLLFRDPDSPPGTFDGIARGKMKMNRVQEILHAVSRKAEIVGLAIAEYLPWSVIKFAADLERLPLLGSLPAKSAE